MSIAKKITDFTPGMYSRVVTLSDEVRTQLAAALIEKMIAEKLIPANSHMVTVDLKIRIHVQDTLANISKNQYHVESHCWDLDVPKDEKIHMPNSHVVEKPPIVFRDPDDK